MPEHEIIANAVNRTRKQYSTLFPGSGGGIYTDRDWVRLGFVANLVVGSVLDVGVGNNAFLHILHEAGFKGLGGVDVERTGNYVELPGVPIVYAEAATMPIASGSYDTVTCMETLEHMPPDECDKAVHKLRDVARRRIVVTVPYKEREPLMYAHLPRGHKHSFDDDKLARLFPTATACLIPWGIYEWCVVLEDKQRPRPAFELVESGMIGGRCVRPDDYSSGRP